MNSFDYWVQLGISQVWVVAAFGLGMGIMRLIDNRLIATLKEPKESAENRLKKVKGRVAEQDKSAQGLFKRVATLEKAVTEKRPLSTIKPLLKGLVTDSGALADSTRVTSDLLTRYWDKKGKDFLKSATIYAARFLPSKQG